MGPTKQSRFHPLDMLPHPLSPSPAAERGNVFLSLRGHAVAEAISPLAGAPFGLAERGQRVPNGSPTAPTHAKQREQPRAGLESKVPTQSWQGDRCWPITRT